MLVPTYVPPPSWQEVTTFLGREGDAGFQALAEKHVELVVAFVRAYTRGRGFVIANGAEMMAEDLRAVVITGTARLVTNPAQLERETSAEYTAVGSFAGWTLPELAVLHQYRRRTA